MATPMREVVTYPIRLDVVPGGAGESLSLATIGQDMPDILAVEGVAQARRRSATVRWSLLIGDLMQVAQTLPGPVVPKPRRRRIGEAAQPVVPAAAMAEHDGWLDMARAHVLGLMSRHCCLEAAWSQAAGPVTADSLEARLMVLMADDLLGRQLPWAGRDAWRRRSLASYLFNADGAVPPAIGHTLMAHLAAADPRFTTVLPILNRLGLAARLLPGEEARKLVSVAPPVPYTGAPGVPLPRRGDADRRASAPLPVARIGQRRWHWAVLAGVALAGVLGWQQYLWQEAVGDLAGRLASGG